jgi:two-component system, cell cycle sensor histidine kinase and response regulator CckA
MAGTTLLVVEDELVVAEDLRSRLTGLGYEIVGVTGSGDEAVDLALRLRPRLVLMDIRLRGETDGITAAERIRASSDIPVIFLTAYADAATLRRAQVPDPFGYLLKPFDERDLHITIEMALAKHRHATELQEHRRRLDTILRSIGDAVIAADLQGRVTFMNPVAEGLTGWSETGARGEPLTSVFRASGGSVRETLLQILPGSIPPDGPTVGSVPLLFARDGRSLPIDMNATPVRDDTGRVTGAVVVFRDASARESAGRALRQSEERYRAFFEDDLTGDYIAAGDGTILECNPAFVRMLGFPSVEDALGKNLHAHYPDRDACERFLGHLRTERRLAYYEKELRTLDGRRVYVIENASGVMDGRGDLLQYKGYMFDDTVRKQLEEQLHHMQKMESIGTLASGIAHDFNNIINNVLGFSTQMKKHVDDPAKILKYAQTIEKSATRGAELSAQLLSFARVGQREMKPLDAGHVIEEVAALCSETFPKQITIDRHIDPDLHPVRGDHGGLYQVLMNLCVNARDALTDRGEGNGGTIRLVARNTVAQDALSAQFFGDGTPCVELRVEDDGVGIPDDLRERIFDPFFTTKEKGKGTGLGLAVVYTIVRSHRGVLSVESTEGRGSTFRVLLPAAPGGVAPAAVDEERETVHGRGETVLVVDDEDSMQELARDLLEEAGFRVITAGSGMRAIEIYRERGKEIDLVILDLVMSGLDGTQTYRELKRLDPQVRAFFCTGYMPDQVTASLLEREQLQAVLKPFKPESLVRIVRETLDRHRAG